MDPARSASAPADYLGLKEELQKIAAIIDQYPDQLKQRAFELLINAYLGRAHAEGSSVPAERAPVESPSEAITGEIAPASAEETQPEELIAEVSAGGEENESSLQAGEQSDATLETESQIAANLANPSDRLRRRIRLRTMSQTPWAQSG